MMSNMHPNYDRLFHKIDEAQVVLVSRGVYKQAAVFRRFDGKEHGLYAAASGGYVRLHGAGGTSAPRITWLDLDMDGALLRVGQFGRPALDEKGAAFMLPPPA